MGKTAGKSSTVAEMRFFISTSSFPGKSSPAGAEMTPSGGSLQCVCLWWGAQRRSPASMASSTLSMLSMAWARLPGSAGPSCRARAASQAGQPGTLPSAASAAARSPRSSALPSRLSSSVCDASRQRPARAAHASPAAWPCVGGEKGSTAALAVSQQIERKDGQYPQKTPSSGQH